PVPRSSRPPDSAPPAPRPPQTPQNDTHSAQGTARPLRNRCVYFHQYKDEPGQSQPYNPPPSESRPLQPDTRGAVAAGPARIAASLHRANLPRHPRARAGDRAAPQHRARQSRPALSLSQHVQSVAVAANYILSLLHFLFESRIVRRQLVSPFRPLNQK